MVYALVAVSSLLLAVKINRNLERNLVISFTYTLQSDIEGEEGEGGEELEKQLKVNKREIATNRGE